LKTQLTVFLAGLAGWLNRKQQDVIDYLHAENEILKEQFQKKGGKLDLSNPQRRNLAEKVRRSESCPQTNFPSGTVFVTSTKFRFFSATR
jgi:Tfp pilus assembly protein PilO